MLTLHKKQNSLRSLNCHLPNLDKGSINGNRNGENKNENWKQQNQYRAYAYAMADCPFLIEVGKNVVPC